MENISELLHIRLNCKGYVLPGLAILAVASFISLAFPFAESLGLIIGAAGFILVLFEFLVLPMAQGKAIAFLLLFFPLLGNLLYNVTFLNITLKTGIPAGGLFDLVVVGVFLAWTVKKMVKSGGARNAVRPNVVRCLDHLMFFFLFFVGFQYVRGIMLGSKAIFSEGRGFLYYLLYFPIADAINVKDIQFEKLNKALYFLSFIYLGFFILDIHGLLLPSCVQYVEQTRGFTFLAGGITRTSLIDVSLSMVLFLLSLFLFLSSDTRTGRGWALMTMLISLFINIRGNTRGYQVGLLVGLFASFILMGRRYQYRLLRYLPVLFLLLVIGSAALLYFYGDQAQVLLSRWQNVFHADPNVIQRIIQVRIFGVEFLKHPFIGNNLGTTQTYFAPAWDGIREFTDAGPHTEVVYWLYALGIVGTGLFGVIAFLIAKMGLSNAKSCVLSNQARAVQKSILAILAALFVVSFSSWQFRSWAMVPIVAAMFAYTRNLYLLRFHLQKHESEIVSL